MDIEQLQELADRLARAKGPNQDLDEILWAGAHGWSYPLRGAAWADKRQYRNDGEKQDYTGSTDAALALVEQLLPGWYVENLGKIEIGWTCTLRLPINDIHRAVDAPTPALAILRATVCALIAKHTHEASQDLDEDDQDLGASGPRM